MKGQILKTVKQSRKAWFLKEQMQEEATMNRLLDHYSEGFNDLNRGKPLFKFFKDWENADLQSHA